MTKCPACHHESLTVGRYCANCGARLAVDARSMRWRWLTWALGLSWSVITLAVIMTYHVGTGGFGGDVTLYQQDHFLFWEFLWIESAVLGVAGADLALRSRHHSTCAGVPTQVLGACVAFFSLFGLLYGLASLGVVAALMAASARAFALRVVPVSQATTAGPDS